MEVYSDQGNEELFNMNVLETLQPVIGKLHNVQEDNVWWDVVEHDQRRAAGANITIKIGKRLSKNRTLGDNGSTGIQTPKETDPGVMYKV